MTEIVIMMRDFPHPDPDVHVRRYHRGDILDYRVDGHPWSQAELTQPKFRHIRIGLTMTEVDFMAKSEDDPIKNKGRLWARVRKFDLDSILIGPGAFKEFLMDDTRTVPIFISSVRTALDPLIFEKGDADDFTRV